MSDPWGKNVTVEFDNGIAFVALNRPEKRNAMSPDLNAEMLATIDALELDERCGVLVLTGNGDAFSAGMDLKEYFRATDDGPQVKRMQVYRTAATWQWRRLLTYFKPTIAMVNGWCFGGAFTPMVACDIAIAADEATFGVSEVNWGIIPGGNVSKVLSVVMNYRKALYYIMSGETFDGKKAAELGVVTESVPRAQLKARVTEVGQMLLKKNPTAVRQAKVAFKYVDEMTWDESAEYLSAKSDQLRVVDPEKGRAQGMSEFLDKKTYRPGLGEYKRDS
jgi:trans-feruloyl-CoA hydratase/vanillin synthase